MAEVAEAGAPFRGARLRVSAALWRRPWLKAAGLLALPVLAFAIVYLGALAALFVSAFWQVDAFTGQVVHVWTFDNFRTLWDDHTYWRIAGRTVGMAAAVTLTDAILAFPLAYFMAKFAPPRLRALLFVLVLLPLWTSYLVRIYAWRTILANNGALNWALNGIGLPDVHLAFTNWAMWIVFSYVWLPFMVIPVYAALERIPQSYLEASGDLGARGYRTFRSVILPLALPGVVAGSIFTFSLTLGDYVTPLLVGGADSSFIGNVVYENIGVNANVPFVAAFAIHRFRFFGRESVSFLLLLPIALPGIITGMALNSFYVFAGIGFSIWTIVIGHATFCVVVVYNNVLARLRRTSTSLLEASMDLGADGWQTFRYVLWPVLSTALVAGGLLAFALSFDEVIVTTFTAGAQTTIPIFILDNLRQGQQLPVVNVVAFVVILLTIVPVWISARLTRDAGILRRG